MAELFQLDLLTGIVTQFMFTELVSIKMSLHSISTYGDQMCAQVLENKMYFEF